MRGLVAIAATLVLVPRLAAAQPSASGAPSELSSGTSDGAGPTEAQVEAARLFDRGDTHFNLGEYDEAIAAFKAGYRLHPAPAFLYNLGQAYRLKGSCRAAARMYTNYLRLRPEDPNREAIATQQAEMETCGQHQRLHDFVDGDAAAARAVRRRVGLGLAGGGVVAAAIGIYFAVDARDASQEIDAFYDGGGTWNPGIAAVEERGRRAEVVSISLLAAGGALALAGGVLRYLGREPASPDGPSLALDVRAGARTVGASWRF
jgi:tetratricopeptide (TPR) repeat protein